MAQKAVTIIRMVYIRMCAHIKCGHYILPMKLLVT